MDRRSPRGFATHTWLLTSLSLLHGYCTLYSYRRRGVVERSLNVAGNDYLKQGHGVLDGNEE